jgi:hypothetical protein
MTEPMSIPDRNRANFQKNLDHLRAGYPELHGKILARRPEDNLMRARTGELTLKIRGRFIESPYHPRRDPRRDSADRGAENRHPDSEEGPVFYLGSGLGYRINDEQKLNRGARPAVLIERDLDVFRAALYIIEPPVFQRLVPLIDADVKHVVREISNLAQPGSDVIIHDRSAQLHREYYREIRQAIRRLIHENLASRTTVRASMHRWIGNVIENLLSLSGRSYTTRNLLGAFSGPTLLVASGPYLEDAADSLARLSKRVPVISLLPSVGFLHKLGIVPDFAVSTDAGFWNRYLYVRGSAPSLIAAYSADPVLLKNWQGQRFLFSHDLPVERLVPVITRESLSVPMQGTSAMVMILLARLMGFTELLLAGFDFAFKDLKDHHRGAGFENLLGSTVTRLLPWSTVRYRRMRAELVVEDRDCFGRTVASSHKLLLYRNWFEREIPLQGLKRLNNGALIEGVSMATEDELSGYDRCFRESFHRRFLGVTRELLTRESAEEGVCIIGGYLEGVNDRSDSPERVRELLFGPITNGPDVADLSSDLVFMEKLLERVKNRGRGR